MGICASTKGESKRFEKTDHKDSINSIVEEYIYGMKQLGTTVIPIEATKKDLKFEFFISNVKGKSLSENNYYMVKIVFDSPKNTFILPMSSGKSPLFNFEKFIFMDIPFEKLEKSYCEITVYSLPLKDIVKSKNRDEFMVKSNILSVVKVDLLTIAIGPEHHDLKLINSYTKQPVGRISFNISCYHLEDLKMRIKNIKFILPHPVIKDIAVKMVFNNVDSVVETDYTMPLAPNIVGNRTTYEYIEKEGKTSEIKEANPLSLNLRLSMNDLKLSNISLNLFDFRFIDKKESFKNIISDDKNTKLQETTSFKRLSNKGLTYMELSEKKHDMDLQPKYSHLAYSNLNFHQILSENEGIITKQSSMFFRIGFDGNNEVESSSNQIIKFKIFDNVLKPFSEKIISEGKELGLVEGSIEISNIPLIRQIMCGVHTERGFDISSVYLNLENNLLTSKSSVTDSTIPAELNILAMQKNNLLENLIKHTGLTYSSSNDFNTQVLNTMKQILTTLGKSYKESCLIYNYSHNKDLFEAQKIMLDIGINIIKLMESFNMEQRVKGFQILVLLNNRAEFDLGTVWRSWFEDVSTQSKFRDNTLVDDKIIENFVEFNNLCLHFSLDVLSRGYNDKEARSFVEFFLSVAYFRIPKFRKVFLEIISKNLVIESIKIDDHGSIDSYIENNPVNNLIVWENIFYRRLNSALIQEKSDEFSGIKDKMSKTDEILTKDNMWKERLGKRGTAFFSMIKRLEQYIRQKVVMEIDLNWIYLPGFSTIIESVVYELKKREVSTYPQQLIDLMVMFTNNPDIINNFTNVIIHHTNANDANGVFNLVNILDAFFSDPEFKKKQISSKFNYLVMKQAVLIIFSQVDHCLVIAKLLRLYYKNCHFINFDHLVDVFQYIIKTKFYEYFFHWSWQLRNIFFHLLLYIVNYLIRNHEFKGGREDKIAKPSSNHNYTEMLRNSLIIEYQEKMNIISMVKKQIENDGLDPSFNSVFKSKKIEFNDIPNELRGNVVIAMNHYDSVEKPFVKFEAENKRRKMSEQMFPVLEIQTPKDDVIEYPDTW